MKQVAKRFISQFKKLEYPISEKSELVTRFLYSALMDQKDKKDSAFNTSVINDINEKNPIIEKVYKDIVYAYLPKRDFRELNNECIIKFQNGPFITIEFYRLVTELLQLKSSDILLHVNAPDEAFITEATKISKNGPLRLSTIAIPDNDRAAELIKMRLELYDITCTIVDEIEKVKRFKPSKVFINPIYKFIDKSYRYSSKNNKFWEDLTEIMNFIPSGSKVIALVPSVMLSNSLDKSQKEPLLKNGYVEGIISLPLRYYSKGLEVETSLIVLSKENRFIKIVDINKIFTMNDVKSADLNSITNYILDCYDSNYSVINPDLIIKKDSNLLISNIVSDEIYDDFSNPVVLSQIADVYIGLKKTKIDFNDLQDQSGESSYCLLGSNDISEGIIDYENLTRIIFDSKYDRYIVKKGDVVITNKSTRIKIAVIEDDKKKIIPTGSMIIISPHEKELDGIYLKMFFESDKGAELLSKVKRGQKTNTINPRDIEMLCIPHISYKKQVECSKIYKDKMNEIISKKLELESLENELYRIINKGGQNYGDERFTKTDK